MQYRNIKLKIGSLILVCLSSASIAAAEEPAELIQERAAAQAMAIPMGVSIDEMMVGFLDRAADGVWQPAAKDELTDAEWKLVEQEAINIILASTLTTMPGTGIEDLKWVQDRDWLRYTNEMKQLGHEARESAIDQDMERLRLVGDRLVEVCSACHQDFKPGLPVMGVTRLPAEVKNAD